MTKVLDIPLLLMHSGSWVSLVPRPLEPAPPLALPSPTLTPAPEASLSPAERLKALARSYGADEVCITDPYVMVKEPEGYVLCAACNKRLGG